MYIYILKEGGETAFVKSEKDISLNDLDLMNKLLLQRSFAQPVGVKKRVISRVSVDKFKKNNKVNLSKIIKI